jgi:hypothetical protein
MIPTLTDDEIVAVSIDGGTAWPLPLITVDSELAAMSSARLRGIRSLTIRELTVDEAPNQELSSIVKAATSATRWCAALGVDKDGSPLVGTSTYVLDCGDGLAVIDLVSVDGTHRLSSTTIADAHQLLVALAKNVFDFGFSGVVPGAQLLVGCSDRDAWVAVQEGSTASAEVASDRVTFGPPSSDWTPEEITRTLVD